MEGLIDSQKIVFYLILLSSVCIHEWAHAFVADKLGDPTPRLDGRVTLNPAAHIDMIGTVILPLVVIMLGSGGLLFGWGKSVQVNPKNFKNYKRDDIIVTAAGPASNLLICLLVAIISGIAIRLFPSEAIKIAQLFRNIVLLNCLLALFNLLPIPPLDGSHILKHAIDMKEETFMKLSQWSMLIMIIFIFSPLSIPFHYAVYFLSQTPFTDIMVFISGAQIQ